jgi:hypothetical protein
MTTAVQRRKRPLAADGEAGAPPKRAARGCRVLVASRASQARALPPPAAAPELELRQLAFGELTEPELSAWFGELLGEDAPPPARPAARDERSLLLELPSELIALVAAALGPDDALPAKLACRALRDALAQPPRATSRTTTSVQSIYSSLAKLQWGVACGVRLSSLCCAQAASRGLEQLRWLRLIGCPWDAGTCAAAAWVGQLAVLQWARADGCPWDRYTCARAAEGGHLSVLQWARQWLPVGRVDVHACGRGWPPVRAAMGARQWLPVGRSHVRACSKGWPPVCAAVGARQWLPVG